MSYGVTVSAACMVSMASWAYHESERASYGSYRKVSYVNAWVFGVGAATAHLMQVYWPVVIGVIAFLVQFNRFQAYNKVSGKDTNPPALTLLGIIFMGWTALNGLHTEEPRFTESGDVELVVHSWWGIERKMYIMHRNKEGDWLYQDKAGRTKEWTPPQPNEYDNEGW